MDAITYLSEEKIQNLFCIFLGSLSIILSLIFLGIIKYSFYKGMAIPLLVFGALQLATGLIVSNRITADIIKVKQMQRQDFEKTKTEELLRMQKLQENFTTYKWLEMALMLCGIIIYIRFRRSPLTFWKGLGLGLLLQAGISLSLDCLGESRARRYSHFLESNS